MAEADAQHGQPVLFESTARDSQVHRVLGAARAGRDDDAVVVVESDVTPVGVVGDDDWLSSEHAVGEIAEVVGERVEVVDQ